MQDAQLRGLIGLSLVVVVLVGLLSLPDDPDADRGDEAVQALDLPDLDAVIGLELVRADDTVVLARQGQSWQVMAPFQAAADGGVVDRALDDLREISWGQAFDAEQQPLSEFGLGDVPEVKITLSFADGHTQSLDLGTPSPVGWHSYAQTPDGQLLVVPGRPGELLADSAENFRDRRLLQFAPADARTVRIEGTQGVLDVRGQGSHWFIDGFTRADPDRVDDLVMGLLDLRFDKVLELEDGLADPRYTVTVHLEGAPDQTFRVGDTTPMGVIVQGPTASGVVYPQSLALITQGPADLGVPNVLGLRAERDDRVVVEVSGQTWTANRTDSGWSIEGVPDGVALAKVVALSEIEIVYQRDPAPALTEVTATLVVTRNAQPRSVQFGQEIGEGLRTAQDVDGGAPFRVRAHVVDWLQPPSP